MSVKNPLCHSSEIVRELDDNCKDSFTAVTNFWHVLRTCRLSIQVITRYSTKFYNIAMIYTLLNYNSNTKLIYARRHTCSVAGSQWCHAVTFWCKVFVYRSMPFRENQKLKILHFQGLDPPGRYQLFSFDFLLP